MFVLDTHIIIWDALTPERLSTVAREAIAAANRQDGLVICDISLWEIAMLLQKGRVQLAVDTQTFLNLLVQANRTIIRPITREIATRAVTLAPGVTEDPAGRLIAATALAENAPLATADRNLQVLPGLASLW